MTVFDFELAAKLKKARKEAKKAHVAENAKLSALGTTVNQTEIGQGSILSTETYQDTQKRATVKFDRNRGILASWRTLRNALDEVFSLYIRIRDKSFGNGLCKRCGIRPIVVCYHILPRSEMGVRWDEDNAIGTCRGCNWHERMTRRTGDDHYNEWIKRLGPERMIELDRRANAKKKFSRDELADMLRHYRNKLAGLK